MIDREVERLRRLRAVALRVRTVARALTGTVSAAHPGLRGDALLNRGRCAAWRVARTVSGRLRAHPYESFQRDPGIGVVVANSLVAANAVMGVKTRHQALLRFEAHLRSLARDLADVRALTRASELNDGFGRSQVEIRALLAALTHETGGSRVQDPAAISPVTEAGGAAIVDPDWPFLAF